MSAELLTNNPERRILDDNARKFVVGPLDSKFLNENHPLSFDLTVDWLETGENNEKKIVYKKFDSGEVQLFLVSKVTVDGNRTTIKELISKEKYEELLSASETHLEKRRHEFKYAQNDISFSVTYDEFPDGKLYMIEVDASNDEERNLFRANDFPDKLAEVTGEIKYYGYRVAAIL